MPAPRWNPDLDMEQSLDQGGFPEPPGISDGDRLRRQYVADIVERDRRERLGARSSQPAAALDARSVTTIVADRTVAAAGRAGSRPPW